MTLKVYFDILELLDDDALSNEEKDYIREEFKYNEEFINLIKDKKDWTYREHDLLLNLLQPQKGESGYFVDRYGNRVSYNGNRFLKKSKTELEECPIHKIEREKCEADFKYFRKYYCIIKTRKGKGRPEPRPYQEKLEDALISGDDVAVLFSRQSGKSVTVATYLLWKVLFHPYGINIGIVANRPKTAKEVLGKLKKIYIELPLWLQKGIEVWNKSDIEVENGTKVLTDSPSGDAFRGETINILYCDEVAYLDKNLWEEMLDSIIPTMSSLEFKQLIYTSTPNGVNHWEEIVRRAREGSNGMTLIENDWKEVPHYDKNGNLMSPEEYKEMVVKKYGMKLFLQTEECEFLGSSNTLISGNALEKILRKVTENESNIIYDTGFKGLQLLEYPKKGHLYIVGVDTSKDGLDEFSINIVDITQFPFRQVGVANIQTDYLVMPEYLDELGRMYNSALIVIENNEGSGQSIADALFNIYEYENLYRDKNTDGRPGFKRYPGFRTTTKSRPLILSMLKTFIEEDKLEVNFEDTLKQFYVFTKQKGKYQAEPGYRDDNILSLAMIFAPFMENKSFDDYELFVKSVKAELDDENIVKTTDFLSVIGGFTNDEYDEEEELRVAALRRYREKFMDEVGDESYGLSF